MREIVLILQFLVSHETYHVNGELVKKSINGKIVFNSEVLYMSVDGVRGEFPVTTYKDNYNMIVLCFLMDNRPCLLVATPYKITVDYGFRVVKYEVKKTNFSFSDSVKP